MQFLNDYGILLFWVSLITLAVFNYLYRNYKNRNSDYHRYIKKRNNRLSQAENQGDYRVVQQIELEKKWVLGAENTAIRSYIFGRLPGLTQQELDARTNTIYAEIDAEELILPNVHNITPKNRVDCTYFLDGIVNDYVQVLKDSEYSGNYFFPERILPYPKQYLLFALNYLISKPCRETNYARLQLFLLEHCIDINPLLLPLDPEKNKIAGEQYLVALK